MNLKNICPICAAVVATWATLLALLFFGYNIDKTLLAMLMGMSVGAIATKYGHNIYWKTGMVILGGAAVWLLLNGKIGFSLITLAVIILISIPSKVNKLESKTDKFEDCC